MTIEGVIESSNWGRKHWFTVNPGESHLVEMNKLLSPCEKVVLITCNENDDGGVVELRDLTQVIKVTKKGRLGDELEVVPTQARVLMEDGSFAEIILNRDRPTTTMSLQHRRMGQPTSV